MYLYIYFIPRRSFNKLITKCQLCANQEELMHSNKTPARVTTLHDLAH